MMTTTAYLFIAIVVVVFAGERLEIPESRQKIALGVVIMAIAARVMIRGPG